MPAFKTLSIVIIITLCLKSHQVIAQKLAPPPFILKEWEMPYQPFRIVGNLYYVGTYDLACYLITTSEGNILVNTGLAESVGTIGIPSCRLAAIRTFTVMCRNIFAYDWSIHFARSGLKAVC